MAIKLVTLKNKNGDVYYPKTSVEQVDGLDTALQVYPTTQSMNQAIAEGQVFRDTIKVADLSNQQNWAKEDEYLVGNDADGYRIYKYVYKDETKKNGNWQDVGGADDVSLEGYLTEQSAAATYATKSAVAARGAVYFVNSGADLGGCGDADLIVEIGG